MSLRQGLTIAWYTCMVTGGACLVYLLFSLGHSDTMPILLNLTVAGVASLSGITLAMLQWIGLPPEPEDEPEKKSKKSSA